MGTGAPAATITPTERPRQHIDVLIVGAGPAGLATAATLLETGFKGHALIVEKGRPLRRRICPVDRGGACHGCGGICNVLSGFGGGIHYGDAVKLSQLPSGRRLRQALGPSVDAHFSSAIHLVEDTIKQAVRFTFPSETEHLPVPAPKNFHFKAYPVGSLPAATVRTMLEHLHDRLTEAPDIDLRQEVSVVDIQPNTSGGYDAILQPLRGGRETVTADQVVIGTGRAGLLWWRATLRKLGLAYELPQPSVGLRFEMNHRLLQRAAVLHPDYKVTQICEDKKLKSFCFCAGSGGGRLKCTDYGPFALLDGHVQDAEDLEVTPRVPANFALLYQVPQLPAGDDPFPYMMQRYVEVYRRLRPERPGKPVAQLYADFRRRRAGSTTWSDLEAQLDHDPCIRDLVPARVDALFDSAEHQAFVTAFERFMDVVLAYAPDVASDAIDNALVVALELEGLWDTVVTDVHMESSLPGLFVTGDALGQAQGILQAMTTGVAAAHRIVERADSAAHKQSNRDRLVYDQYWRVGEHLEPSETFTELVVRATASATPRRPLIGDLGCGIGRHALYAARHAADVVAVDFSSRAIARLREIASQDDLVIEVIENDVREWLATSVATLDGLVCFDVLHHLAATTDGVLEQLAAMRRRVQPAGYVLITMLAGIDYGRGGAPAGRLLVSVSEAEELLDVAAFADAQLVRARRTPVRFDKTVNLDPASGQLVNTHYTATRVLRLYRLPP
jgi:uncharacterized protein